MLARVHRVTVDQCERGREEERRGGEKESEGEVMARTADETRQKGTRCSKSPDESRSTLLCRRRRAQRAQGPAAAFEGGAY